MFDLILFFLTFLDQQVFVIIVPYRLRGLFGTGGPWESEPNEGMTIWYLAVLVCRSSRGHSNTGLAVVASHGSNNNSRNGLAAVVFISINVAFMSFLPPDRRNSSNR